MNDNKSDPISFQRTQHAFTAYVREPTRQPPLNDVPVERLAVYAELVFKNIDSLLRGCFPVLHGLLPATAWQALTREFLVKHRAQTPLFSRLPCEFLAFLQSSELGFEPPFMRELAFYEWLELEVSYDERELDAAPSSPVDLLHGVPILNPTARPHAFHYPVHRISVDFQPSEPLAAPVYLVVFRTRSDDVAFMELTPMTAKLVELIAQNPAAKTGEQLLLLLAEELAHPDPPALVGHGRAMLQDLGSRELLLGTRA